jgi:cell division protein FtsQ
MKEKLMNWFGTARKIAIPAALLIVLITLAAFADKQQSEQRCEKIRIDLSDAEKCRFVSTESVLDLITKKGQDEVVGKKTSAINLDKIESRLLKDPYVKKVDAHFDMSGDLIVTIEQKKPVIRVINPLLQSYYLDVEGKRIPLSEKYTAFVPVATPEFYDFEGDKDSVLNALDSSLFIFAEYLQKDSFARALTGQILIEKNNEFTLIPRLGNFTIFIGDVADLNDKMERLRSFYRVSLPQAGWDKYSRINLKYKNQIIANH